MLLYSETVFFFNTFYVIYNCDYSSRQCYMVFQKSFIYAKILIIPNFYIIYNEKCM